MPTGIWQAIIGAVALVLGAIINSYRDEIRNAFVRGDRYEALKGTWECRWKILAPSTASPAAVDDQVTVDRVRGALVRGTGSAPGFGKYKFEGKASDFAVTLEYAGQGERKDLVGVVILKKQSPTGLQGVWCQYSADGTLKSGTTDWEKIR